MSYEICIQLVGWQQGWVFLIEIRFYYLRFFNNPGCKIMDAVHETKLRKFVV